MSNRNTSQKHDKTSGKIALVSHWNVSAYRLKSPLSLMRWVLNPPHKHGPKIAIIIEPPQLARQNSNKNGGYIPVNVRLISQEFVQRLESLDLGEIGERHCGGRKESHGKFFRCGFLVGGFGHDRMVLGLARLPAGHLGVVKSKGGVGGDGGGYESWRSSNRSFRRNLERKWAGERECFYWWTMTMCRKGIELDSLLQN